MKTTTTLAKSLTPIIIALAAAGNHPAWPAGDSASPAPGGLISATSKDPASEAFTQPTTPAPAALKHSTAIADNLASSKAHYGQQAGDLPNFHKVHSFLYRGGQPTEAGLLKLKEMGVKTIIDLRNNPEKVFNESKAADSLGLQCINLPMSSRAPTQKQVETFLKIVEAAKQDPSKGAVFVHCAHGSDRTGCLVGLWRVTHDGWDYPKTYKEMRQYWFTPKFTHLSDTVAQYAAQNSAR